MAINWTNQGNQLQSDCSRFIIINKGQKRGVMYVLYEYHEQHQSYCRVRRVGRYQQVKDFAETL